MDEINVLNIHGKDCYLVDSITDFGTGNAYHFFSNIDDASDMYILKDKNVDGKECFVAVSEMEFLDAMTLFYEKHKDDSKNTN